MNGCSYPKLEKGKLENERYLSMTLIHFKSAGCFFQVRVLSILQLSVRRRHGPVALAGTTSQDFHLRCHHVNYATA